MKVGITILKKTTHRSVDGPRKTLKESRPATTRIKLG